MKRSNILLVGEKRIHITVSNKQNELFGKRVHRKNVRVTSHVVWDELRKEIESPRSIRMKHALLLWTCRLWPLLNGGLSSSMISEKAIPFATIGYTWEASTTQAFAQI